MTEDAGPVVSPATNGMAGIGGAGDNDEKNGVTLNWIMPPKEKNAT